MIRIDKQFHQAMVKQLETVLPLEGCGIMAGKDGTVVGLYPITNQLAKPYAYEMDPDQQLKAMIAIEDQGLDMLAIYHSHPLGPDSPSQLDVQQAYYPESAYVIVSLRDHRNPSVRAFQISDGRVIEIPYSIV